MPVESQPQARITRMDGSHTSITPASNRQAAGRTARIYRDETAPCVARPYPLSLGLLDPFLPSSSMAQDTVAAAAAPSEEAESTATVPAASVEAPAADATGPGAGVAPTEEQFFEVCVWAGRGSVL